MFARFGARTVAAIACLGMVAEANAHEIPWPRGISRQMGVGSCAKGPCIRRTSFDPTVPHSHLTHGKCKGLGAAGYTYGRLFDCLQRR